MGALHWSPVENLPILIFALKDTASQLFYGTHKSNLAHLIRCSSFKTVSLTWWQTERCDVGTTLTTELFSPPTIGLKSHSFLSLCWKFIFFLLHRRKHFEEIQSFQPSCSDPFVWHSNPAILLNIQGANPSIRSTRFIKTDGWMTDMKESAGRLAMQEGPKKLRAKKIKPDLGEGSVAGRQRSISIVLLNGELIHAQKGPDRGWERDREIIIADLHLLLEARSSLWLVYFRRNPLSTDYMLTPAHQATTTTLLTIRAWRALDLRLSRVSDKGKREHCPQHW